MLVIKSMKIHTMVYINMTANDVAEVWQNIVYEMIF